MTRKAPPPDAGQEKQRPLEAARQKGQAGGFRGNQPHEIAENATMKRQQKKMHKQDNK